MTSPYLIALDAADRQRLTRWVWAGSTQQKLVLRALIVLLAADGTSNTAIAEELAICVDTARKWRARFHDRDRGIDGLTDAPRSGRPPIYTLADRAKVTAWACQLPAQQQMPLSGWSTPELAARLRSDAITASMSTVRR